MTLAGRTAGDGGPRGAAAPLAAPVRTALLPLAITLVDDREACVGAVTADGRWVRPEPIAPAWVTGSAIDRFRYWRWTEVTIGPPVVAAPRPEDRALLDCAHRPEAGVSPAERAELLRRLADPSADSALGDARRSLALVRAEIQDLYARRSTGGRVFLRCRFRDGSGAEHDWIVPEVASGLRARPHLVGARLDPGFQAQLVADLAGASVYLALGLTRPNGRFPGRYGGCHPLVVGVHRVGDTGQETDG